MPGGQPLLGPPDTTRYLDCEEAYKQCLWLENRGYKVLKDHQVPGRQQQQSKS